ncbi:PRD domain protein [Enterococcus faecalis 13-SD-W-01]|nr:PRD domain protein [Enterococcus faecalis 13-SD-W-01]
MMRLTKREIQLLLKLLDSEQSCTTKELAETFQVSIRTIKYDLDSIRLWLKPKKINLCAQRNKGFWFEISKEERAKQKHELLEKWRFEVYPSSNKRIEQIVLHLLLTEGVTTIAQLADQLEVSKNTIISDLEKVRHFVKSHHLSLKSQSGQGIWLEGEEKQCRFLMDHLLHQNLTEYDIYQIMDSLNFPDKTLLSIGTNSSFYEIYQVVVQKAAQIMEKDKPPFDYTELLALTFRMTIAICRLRINSSIGSFSVMKEKQDFLKGTNLPFQLMKTVFTHFGFPLLKDEYDYLCTDLTKETQQQDILKLTKNLIQTVSDDLDIPFSEDEQLKLNLFAHLSLYAARAHHYMNEYNPFTEEIKQRHPQLFEAIRKASGSCLKQTYYLVNDSFISYIALHFLVSIEKRQTTKGTVKVVYVCSTGLGVTSLIQKKFSEEIPQIEIVRFASVLNADQVIAEYLPDIVISIFPLEEKNGCPVVKVNAIPTEKDIKKIKELSAIKQPTRKKKTTIPLISETNAAELSCEIIMKGYLVYEGLTTIFGQQLSEEYKEAFLFHLLLMIHRLFFDQQYQLEGANNFERKVDPLLIQKVERFFEENGLPINQAELSALFNYIQID